MVNDVILNKISSIERCVKRINEVYDSNTLNEKNKKILNHLLLT